MNADGIGLVAGDENKARECLQKLMEIDVRLWFFDEAKNNNSGAPGDKKKVHPGGRKNIFLSDQMMFDAYWSSKNIALSNDKVKSDIWIPYEREHHLD